MIRAAIGIGSNLGDPPANVRAAIHALDVAGSIVRVSRLYRSTPWGKTDQPDFCNAVALIDTQLEARDLLAVLESIERRLGRVRRERWGPRIIDLDILLYGERRIDEPGLHVPHPRLMERAFVLVPLAEVDSRYEQAAAGLGARERETVAPMSGDSIVPRVRALAAAFLETDLMRLRIEHADDRDAVEFRRKTVAPPRRTLQVDGPAMLPPPPTHVEPIKADLVGIVHVRPGARAGERLDGDRELAYVEALGIRNPVRSLGGGRIAGVRCKDGQAVEYGQVLFEIDRG